MKLDVALSKIQAHSVQLNKFQIKKIAIFGSVARDEATDQSDIDILIEFTEDVSLFHFLRTKQYLEELLEIQVDLVTLKALRSDWHDAVLAEAVDAA